MLHFGFWYLSNSTFFFKRPGIVFVLVFAFQNWREKNCCLIFHSSQNTEGFWARNANTCLLLVRKATKIHCCCGYVPILTGTAKPVSCPADIRKCKFSRALFAMCVVILWMQPWKSHLQPMPFFYTVLHNYILKHFRKSFNGVKNLES